MLFAGVKRWHSDIVPNINYTDPACLAELTAHRTYWNIAVVGPVPLTNMRIIRLVLSQREIYHPGPRQIAGGVPSLFDLSSVRPRHRSWLIAAKRLHTEMSLSNRPNWRRAISSSLSSLPPTGGIVVTLVCLLVGWFVRSWRLLWFLENTSQLFMESGTDVQHLPHFTINFWQVKVKVQGQNRCIENLHTDRCVRNLYQISRSDRH